MLKLLRIAAVPVVLTVGTLALASCHDDTCDGPQICASVQNCKDSFPQMSNEGETSGPYTHYYDIPDALWHDYVVSWPTGPNYTQWFAFDPTPAGWDSPPPPTSCPPRTT